MDPLKDLLDSKKAQIKKLKAELKKTADVTKEDLIEERISELESFIKRFKPSVMQPMKKGNIVINFKLYEQFMKKLRGFRVDQEVQTDRLVVTYAKGPAVGQAQLNDITHVFPQGSTFPEGKLYEI